MRIVGLTLIVIGFTSCSRTIEIPENKVGVVYNRNYGVVDTVLYSGQYSINKSTYVTLFDTVVQKFNFSFDIMFNDAKPAIIEFAIDYKIKVDSLPKLCDKYGQPAFEYPFENIVLVEIRSQVRKLFMEKYNSGLNAETIFDIVEKDIMNNGPMIQFIDIKAFSRGQVKTN